MCLKKIFSKSSADNRNHRTPEELFGIFSTTFYKVEAVRQDAALKQRSEIYEMVRNYAMNPDVPAATRCENLAHINTVMNAYAGQQDRMHTALTAKQVEVIYHVFRGFTQIDPNPHSKIFNDMYLHLLQGNSPRLSPEAVEAIITELDKCQVAYETRQFDDDFHKICQQKLSVIFQQFRYATDQNEIIRLIQQLHEEIVYRPASNQTSNSATAPSLSVMQTPINSFDHFMEIYEAVSTTFHNEVEAILNEFKLTGQRKNELVARASQARAQNDLNRLSVLNAQYKEIEKVFSDLRQKCSIYQGQLKVLSIIKSKLDTLLLLTGSIPNNILDFFRRTTLGQIIANAKTLIALIDSYIKESPNYSSDIENTDIDVSNMDGLFAEIDAMEAADKLTENFEILNEIPEDSHKV